MSANGTHENDYDLPSKDTTPKVEKEQTSDDNGSSNEEDVYNVEKLCDHKYNSSKRKFKYLVKWEGYPESDNTWEDEDNIMSEDLVAMYWQELKAKGILREEIMNPSKIKKRPLSGMKVFGSAVKDSTKKRTLNDSKSQSADLDEEPFPPEDESWENFIDQIEAIDRVPGIGLMIYVKWKSGKNSVHPSSVINKRCPQKIIKFYEERLRFTGVPQE